MKSTLKSKDDVQKAFLQLLDARKRNKTQILTKEEQAREAQNQQLVKDVASHTPQNIVKGLADLQLELGVSVDVLAKRLESELKKLDNLRAAIKVQQANLQATLDAKIAANVLYVLKQEQAQRLQQLEEDFSNNTQRLEREIADRRTDWTREQTEFESREAEYKTSLEKTRVKEAEDYTYALARRYKVEQDEYEVRKKMLLRELSETEKDKEAKWAARETVLAANQADLEKFKQKVDNFEQEMQEKANEAREKAIKQTSKECKESMELLEKEVSGKQRVAELQIQNLETLIAQQKADIEKLNIELKEALSQVQQLSLKALEANKK